MAGANTLEFTEDNFEAEVLQSDKPVLVDFWAEWCGPCKLLAPTVDEVADNFAGKAKVGKLDTDANQKIAANYGISAIPTLILFEGGEEVERSVGFEPEKVRSMVEQVVGKGKAV